MEKWTICNKSGDFAGIAERFGISKITARLLVNRGVCTDSQIEAFLNPKITDLHNAELLKNADRTAEFLVDRIKKQKPVRVVGDYDVDGIMATYILSDALRRAGAIVSSYIPHRIKDGYGLNEEIIEQAYADGIDTVITCDNGIAAVPAAKRAGELGIHLLITDHHEIPDELPNAEVIVDPKMEDDSYPCRDICGAVVAAKVAELLFQKAGCKYTPEDYLEFMAMATICDVVPIIDENRAIAKLGMEKLKVTKNPGLKSLLLETTVMPETISEYQIGYILGPCFNATGRIDDAGIALEMLEVGDEKRASELASLCKNLNDERKLITAEQEAVAYKLLDESGRDDSVIVLELPDCHESILGIIAGRVKERYNKPTIIVTKSGDYYKGSGRSIPAYNMFEKLNEVSGCLHKFGGHPMAAGMSIKPECLEEFRTRLNENSGLTKEDMQRKLLLDAEVSFSLFDEKAVEELSLLSPFGPGNNSVVFAERGLKVQSMTYIGKDSTHLRFKLINSYGYEITAVFFSEARNVVKELIEKYGESAVNRAFAGLDSGITLTVAYVPRINSYRDMRSIQMNIKAIKY